MRRIKNNTRARASAAGFSLIELTVAMVMFITVTAFVLGLVRRDAAAFNTQQAQSAINVALRNAVAQMQIDMMSAGAGYYPNVYVPGSPVGVTICNSNSTSCYYYNGSACYTNGTYTNQCFDTLNILQFSSVSPTQPTAGFNTFATNTMTLIPAPNATMTAAQIAAAYTNGTELLLITSATSGLTGEPQIMTVKLTAPATYSGTTITIQYTKTLLDGTTNCKNKTAPCYYNPVEKYLIASTGTDAMTNSFSTADYVLLPSVITYSVDTTTDSTNPRLVRTTPDGVSSVITDRIIGFKIGAMTWGGARSVTGYDSSGDPITGWDGNDVPNYKYDPTTYLYPNDFTLVRSLRVSLIGRTNQDPGTSDYKNGFDGGNYRIEALSTIINPRNLSMLDQ